MALYLHAFAMVFLGLSAQHGVFGSSKSIKSRIYYNIDTYGVCFQRANATHQVGCTSSLAGNVGTVQLVQNSKNLTWLMTNGPQDPYIAVLTENMFNFDTLNRLNGSTSRSLKIVGVIVLRPFDLWRAKQPEIDSLSPEAVCPNEAGAYIYGKWAALLLLTPTFTDYYAFINDTKREHCKNKWNLPINPEGQNLLHYYWRFPIFAVREQEHIDYITRDCYMKFNRPPDESSLPDYPLCQAELRSLMYSATNSQRCMMRSQLVQNPLNPPRSLCDPIELSSVYSFINPVIQPAVVKRSSVILVLARMDVMPLFTDSYAGAISPRASGVDTTVAGLITLIMIANALSKWANHFTSKTIVFAALHGETLDYMGSVRLAYDITHGKFPSRIATNFSRINFDAVDFVIDISQVGKNIDNKLYIHSEALSRNRNATTDAKVNQIVAKLRENSDGLNIVESPPSDQPLPPSSLHSLYKAHPNLASVVLADYQYNYSNRYYMSEYDTLENVDGAYSLGGASYDNPSEFAKRINSIATTVARALYQLSNDSLMTEKTLVADVDLCNCPLFKGFGLASPSMPCAAQGDRIQHPGPRPVPLYQGPEQYPGEAPVRTMQSIFYVSGLPVSGLPQSQCRGVTGSYNLLWFENVSTTTAGRSTGGMCYKSSTFLSSGMSPAFELNDYSGTYPAWTESRWGTDVVLRLFLKPSPTEEIFTLLAGLVLTLFSFVIVYFINRNASTLFALHDSDAVVVTSVTTATTTNVPDAPAFDPPLVDTEDLNVVVISTTTGRR